MSCNCSCSSANLPCCCPTPSVNTTTTSAPCPDGTLCDEVVSSDCIVYNGVSVPCYNIANGSTVTDLLQVLIAKLGPCTTTTTLPAGGVFNVIVNSNVTGGSITAVNPSNLYTGVTLPCTVGNTKTGVLISSLTGGSMSINGTTGSAAAKLLIIKNNITISTSNIAANQTNFTVTITSVTVGLTDSLTIQLVTQA
jgi:hypothetical protein